MNTTLDNLVKCLEVRVLLIQCRTISRRVEVMVIAPAQNEVSSIIPYDLADSHLCIERVQILNLATLKPTLLGSAGCE